MKITEAKVISEDSIDGNYVTLTAIVIQYKFVSKRFWVHDKYSQWSLS